MPDSAMTIEIHSDMWETLDRLQYRQGLHETVVDRDQTSISTSAKLSHYEDVLQ